MNVVAYARFSSDNQRSESIDAQMRAIKEYCLKNNFKIVDVFTDEIKSGLSDERPGFLNMIDAAEKNNFDGIIVHKLDRFSRDRYDSAIYKRKLKKCGVRLYSVLEHLDDSPESIILESVLEGMAEYYSMNLARETAKGLNENALQCLHNGGTPPLGYNVDPTTKKYVTSEYEAETVKIIYDMYLDDCGYFEIIEYLNSCGRKTKRGNSFGKNSIYEILNNEKYSGTYIYNRMENRRKYGNNTHNHKSEDKIIKIPGGMPKIIESAKWKKVKEKMKKNKRTAARYNTNNIYPLSGLLVCGNCGGAYCGKHKKAKGRDYFYYICSSKNNNGSCKAAEVRKDFLEESVIKELEKRLYSSKGINDTARYVHNYAISKKMHDSRIINSSKSELEKINLQINKLLDAIINGMFHESMKDKMTDLENKKYCIEKEIKNYEENCNDYIPNINTIKGMIACENIRLMNEKELKQCFQKYIKKITIQDGDKIQISLVVHTSGTP